MFKLLIQETHFDIHSIKAIKTLKTIYLKALAVFTSYKKNYVEDTTVLVYMFVCARI